MNSVILHIEYLLRHHDCVVFPGWGAFISQRRAARFSMDDPSILLPPCRRLAFNPELREDDGLVTSSICRREKISYHAASLKVSEAAEQLKSRLKNDTELQFGRLGLFVLRGGSPLRFFPAENAVNQAFSYLRPIPARQIAAATAAKPTLPTQQTQPSVADNNNDATGTPYIRPARLTPLLKNAGAIAATLALAITLYLFVVNPIRIDNEPARASIAAVPAAEVSVSQETIRTPSTRESSIPDSKANESETAGNIIVPDTSSPTVPQAQVREYNLSESKPEHNTASIRFNSDDAFCVVVASFPTSEQASQYISEHPSQRLAITTRDGRYRVYAATAPTSHEAQRQKAATGVPDAWVCRK